MKKINSDIIAAVLGILVVIGFLLIAFLMGIPQRIMGTPSATETSQKSATEAASAGNDPTGRPAAQKSPSHETPDNSPLPIDTEREESLSVPPRSAKDNTDKGCIGDDGLVY